MTVLVQIFCIHLRQEFFFFERDYDNFSWCSTAAHEVFTYLKEQSCASIVLYLLIYLLNK